MPAVMRPMKMKAASTAPVVRRVKVGEPEKWDGMVIAPNGNDRIIEYYFKIRQCIAVNKKIIPIMADIDGLAF